MENAHLKKIIVETLIKQNDVNENYLFINNNDYTAISPEDIYLNDNTKVILTNDVYDELKEIQKITKKTNKNISFYLLGEKIDNDNILFDTFLSNYKNYDSLIGEYEDLDQMITEYLLDIENGEYQNNEQIICQGHSRIDSFLNDNYALGDLIAYFEFNEKVNKKYNINTISSLITPSGNLNFLYYDGNKFNHMYNLFLQIGGVNNLKRIDNNYASNYNVDYGKDIVKRSLKK